MTDRNVAIFLLLFGVLGLGWLISQVQAERNQPILYPLYESTRVLDSTAQDNVGAYYKIHYAYTEIIFNVKLVKIVHQPEIVSIHTDQLVRKGDWVRIIRPVHFLGNGYDTQVYLDKILEPAKS